MTQLFGLVLLFLAATAFNINDGVAMLPLKVLFLQLRHRVRRDHHRLDPADPTS